MNAKKEFGESVVNSLFLNPDNIKYVFIVIGIFAGAYALAFITKKIKNRKKLNEKGEDYMI